MANIKTQIVLRNDSLSNWMRANPTLAKGEIGLAQLSGELSSKYELRIGDGVTDWNSLSATNIILPAENVVGLTETIAQLSTSYYETEGNVADLTGSFVNGDIAVEKRTINGALAEFTAYRYDSTLTGDNKWRALDKNYNAANVYFDENLTYTTGLGVIAAPTGGSGTLSVAGKSVEDLFKQILAQESLSISIDKTWGVDFSAGSITPKEVGTTITATPTYTFKITDIPNWASYGGIDENGNKVGQNATGSKLSAEIVGANGTIISAANQTAANNSLLTCTLPTSVWSSSTFTDAGETKGLTAYWESTASTSKPVTNLGNLILSASTEANDKITGITKTGGYSAENYAAAKGKINATSRVSIAKTSTAQGYRSMFIGALATKPDTITSDVIRGLHNLGEVKTTSIAEFKSGSNGWTAGITPACIIIAIPTKNKNANVSTKLSSVLLKSASNTPITVFYEQ